MRRLLMLVAAQLALLGAGIAWQALSVERGVRLRVPFTWAWVSADLAGSYATVQANLPWPAAAEGAGSCWAILEAGAEQDSLVEVRPVPAEGKRPPEWGDPPSLAPGQVAVRASHGGKRLWLESHERLRVDDREAVRLRALCEPRAARPDSMHIEGEKPWGVADILVDRGRIVALQRITIEGESFGLRSFSPRRP